MKNFISLSLKTVFLFGMIAVIFSSCVPQKKMLYMQVKDEADTLNTFYNEKNIEYRMQPGDNLYIKVVSLDEQTSILLNPTGGVGNYLNNDASIYLNSYTVDEKGYLDFPITGAILVKGLTTAEIKEKLQMNLKLYLKEFVLIVKMVNFNLTLLGEVQRPGQYKVYQSSINLFEAVSMASDLTDFANREKVAIIRQTKEGSKVIYLDMTKRDILESEYFYLKPNDIVYVTPVKGKQFTFAQFPYGVVFGAISSTILLLNYFK